MADKVAEKTLAGERLEAWFLSGLNDWAKLRK